MFLKPLIRTTSSKPAAIEIADIPEIHPISTTNGKHLGHGAWGSVRLVTYNGSYAAIKTIAKDRFEEKELGMHQALTLLDTTHHYIIPLYGHFKTLDSYALIMEYAPRGTLSDFLETHMLGLSEKLRLMIEVTSAVHWMHSLGFLHCDIKPSNVLLTNMGEAKLGDFGNTIQIGEKNSSNRLTMAITAPEIMNNEPPSVKSDVYSLAILYWWIMSQQDPYKDYESPFAIALAVMENVRPAVEQIVPEKIAAQITLGWMRHPSERPTSKELLGALVEIKHEYLGMKLHR